MKREKIFRRSTRVLLPAFKKNNDNESSDERGAMCIL